MSNGWTMDQMGGGEYPLYVYLCPPGGGPSVRFSLAGVPREARWQLARLRPGDRVWDELLRALQLEREGGFPRDGDHGAGFLPGSSDHGAQPQA